MYDLYCGVCYLFLGDSSRLGTWLRYWRHYWTHEWWFRRLTGRVR
jgi:hypothetical protein